MANVTHEDLTTWKVEGEVCTVVVTVSLDDVCGALYHVWDEEGDNRLFLNADKDAALEWAENFADNGEPEEGDVERDGFLSDAEADADALASAGMGTDEDYGCFGGEDY